MRGGRGRRGGWGVGERRGPVGRNRLAEVDRNWPESNWPAHNNTQPHKKIKITTTIIFSRRNHISSESKKSFFRFFPFLFLF